MNLGQNHTDEKLMQQEPKEYMMINQRVQICVIKKKDVLLRSFEVVYPEKYKVI